MFKEEYNICQKRERTLGKRKGHDSRQFETRSSEQEKKEPGRDNQESRITYIYGQPCTCVSRKRLLKVHYNNDNTRAVVHAMWKNMYGSQRIIKVRWFICRALFIWQKEVCSSMSLLYLLPKRKKWNKSEIKSIPWLAACMCVALLDLGLVKEELLCSFGWVRPVHHKIISRLPTKMSFHFKENDCVLCGHCIFIYILFHSPFIATYIRNACSLFIEWKAGLVSTDGGIFKAAYKRVSVFTTSDFTIWDGVVVVTCLFR